LDLAFVLKMFMMLWRPTTAASLEVEYLE
jgi:hypothetical protein